MTLIAAVDNHWGIGYNDAPLFRIPADLRRFKELTMGHALLMGRKTFVGLPRLLPGRVHAVLSRDMMFSPKGVIVLRNLEQARAFAQTHETFLIGGGEVYSVLLNDCGLALITKIDAVCEADTFMPNLDSMPGWALMHEGPWQQDKDIKFKYCTYMHSDVPE